MPSQLFDRGKDEVTPVTSSEPVATKVTGFWQEFIRVECDKLILLLLIAFLWRVGQMESMKYVVGGLIVAINHNRFRWN